MMSSPRKHSQVAIPYAKALFELTEEAGVTKAALKTLKDFRQAVSDSHELEYLLASRAYEPNVLCNAVTAVLKKLKAHKLVIQLVRTLVDNHRLSFFTEIIFTYEFLYEESQGTLVAEVFTVKPLTEAYKKKILAALQKKADRKIELKVDVDPSLIAGMVIRVGTVLIDSSINSKLHNLKNHLKRSA